MWWAGKAIFAILSHDEGDYILKIRARHSKPIPGNLEVEINGQEIATYSLGQDWQTFTKQVTLPAGKSVIGIKYEENSADLILDHIEFQKK